MEGAKLPIVQNEPKIDRYKMAYIIHFMLGAGNLLPWNALITAVDYFTDLYPNKHIEKVFSVAYMSSSLLILALMISWGSCIKRVSFRLRMNIGFSMFILCLMVTPVVEWWWGRDGNYVLIVGSVVFCGLADGLIGGSLIGFAGKLPKQYMQAVFAGTASSGVLVSILRIITKASLPQTERGLRTSAHFYFIISTVILFTSILRLQTQCCFNHIDLRAPKYRQDILPFQREELYARSFFLFQASSNLAWVCRLVNYRQPFYLQPTQA